MVSDGSKRQLLLAWLPFILWIHLGQAQTCLTNWTLIQGKCFYFSQDKMNFHDAVEHCSSLAGKLFEAKNDEASIKIGNEAQILFDDHVVDFWIGITDQKDQGM